MPPCQCTCHAAPSRSLPHEDGPPSEGWSKLCLEIQSTRDLRELGPRVANGRVSLSFTSRSSNLRIGYVTDDRSYSTTPNAINGQNTSKVDFPNRYTVDIKRQADGSYAYTITFNPAVTNARVDIGGFTYHVSPSTVRAVTTTPVVTKKNGGEKISPERLSASTTTTSAVTRSPGPVTSPLSITPAVHIPPVSPAEKPLERAAATIDPGPAPSDRAWVGDYHIPHAGEREKGLVTSVLGTASRILPKETQDRLQGLAAGESLVAGSRKVQELFRSALTEVNEYAARMSTVEKASDSLRSKLGLPEGTQVLLAVAGDRRALGGAENIELMLERCFSDHIKIRGFRPPLVAKDDIVVLQAYHEGGRNYMRMSIIQGTDTERAKWSTLTYEATYRFAPARHIEWSVDRNPDEKHARFDEWKAAHADWFTDRADPSQALRSALDQRVVALENERKKAAAEQARIEQKKLELAQQSQMLGKVQEGLYQMGYNGMSIRESTYRTPSIGAADTRTGTFTAEPAADVQFEVTGPDKKQRTLALSSAKGLAKLSPADAELMRYFLFTPYEGDAERSIAKIVRLFPAQVYRPGSFASNFYSPRWYSKELVDGLVPLYSSKKTAEQKRAFLKGLFDALNAEGTVTEESVSTIPQSLR